MRAPGAAGRDPASWCLDLRHSEMPWEPVTSCVYDHTHTHTDPNACTHTHTHADTHITTCTHNRTCTHHTHTPAHIYTPQRMHTVKHIHTQPRHTPAHIHTHTHTHTQSHDSSEYADRACTPFAWVCEFASDVTSNHPQESHGRLVPQVRGKGTAGPRSSSAFELKAGRVHVERTGFHAALQTQGCSQNRSFPKGTEQTKKYLQKSKTYRVLVE